MKLTPEEQAQSIEEGWALYNGGNQFRIRKDGPFKAWISGYDFLVQQAANGSELHGNVLNALPTYSIDADYHAHFQVIRNKVAANKVKQRLTWQQYP